jgi:hypothetical protein
MLIWKSSSNLESTRWEFKFKSLQRTFMITPKRLLFKKNQLRKFRKNLLSLNPKLLKLLRNQLNKLQALILQSKALMNLSMRNLLRSCLILFPKSRKKSWLKVKSENPKKFNHKLNLNKKWKKSQLLNKKLTQKSFMLMLLVMNVKLTQLLVSDTSVLFALILIFVKPVKLKAPTIIHS